ncbi:DUF2913 family protein [Cronobacter dublinensis]|uniref:DUF2913 family protein n=1 Tax=Cronobacter dublinensis TaxID=413497 RepID=UPI00300E3427
MSPDSAYLFDALARRRTKTTSLSAFCRPDLEKLLRPGRQKGAAASLYQHLENLWHACSASLSYPSDLFRLTQAIQRLKAQNWLNTCVADPEWNIPALTAEYAGSSALLVKKSDLVRCFSENGRLMEPVTFQAQGNIINV